MLVLTLLFLNAVGLHRTWGLRSYPGDALYIDGHGKPVYTDTLIPPGLVGRLSTILGSRALVLLHDASGHPLLVTTHRGDQHLTLGLPAIVKRYEQETA